MNLNHESNQAPEQTHSDSSAPEQASNETNVPHHQNDVKTQETSPQTESPKEPEKQMPDWFLKDKFKTVDDQAKSYTELSKKMGKFWGSPQEGYSVEGIQGIEANDPLIASLTPALKEMGVSQEGFQHLVSQYMEANKSMMKVMEDSLRETLTSTDAHTYNSITAWMNDNLTAEESTMIKNNWLMTAEDFRIFNQLRLMAAPSTNVPSSSQTPVKFESSKEVTNDKVKYRQELKAGTRVQDKNYENELAARFRDAATREERNKSR